ncbi:hypothetical protein GCK72_002171 [Caenorhabditis remanei]|uniref:HTH La-type RNA-binding domain-containing protein n=1 Tax=Caenorhabditis remanei TaxID=31234 RepID=A0A6A5HVN8_CAERE|nr:hypothetical protein GCK72_002171 [Caenorhabditis remanei]KAF1770353.1 hypothetical protein GCK72_002171 [Caenorhabditis remanei]
MVGKLDGKTAVENTTSPDSAVGTSSAHSPGMSPSTSASGVSGVPHAPPIPYWFNREVKDKLKMYGTQPQGPTSSSAFVSSNHFYPVMSVPPPMTQDELKQQLRSQLEYYFSRENLISDRFLKIQMDADQFVSIHVVAGFPKVRRLTNDVDLIVEALRDSTVVEMDENCEKVRPITKRTTIIIREIPEEYREEVVKLLEDGPPFTELKYGLNDSWYVTYDNELDTQVAYVSVQHRKNEVTQRPVCARIKAGGPPTVAPSIEVSNGEKNRLAALSNGENGMFQLRELGHTLAHYGFVPIASYRPGEPILSPFEYKTPTFSISSNSLSYHPPGPTAPPPLLQSPPQQQFFYPSSLSTQRNFDEVSTASSTSTRTTASNYNNRTGSRNGVGGGSQTNQFYESRSSFSNSNEFRGRGGSGGRFQGNQSESNGRQTNGRGNWRGGQRNAVVTNGYNHQNNRQNGQQNSWRNEQNPQKSTWKPDQNGQQQNWRKGQNGQQSNWRSEQNGHSSNQWWLNNDRENQNHRFDSNNRYNNRPKPHVSSSSSSSVSSKHFSLDAVETPNNSELSTPPPTSKHSQQYSVPTPSDLPAPPVWPAPNFDRRRKSSEASSTTITTNTTTNTLTPSTPVTSIDQFPTFSDVQETTSSEQLKTVNIENGTNHSNTKVETKSFVTEKEKVRSPPIVPVPVPPTPIAAPSFAFEETAFPSLPKKVEPVKPPQKPTFSSVAAGRRNLVKQMVPEKKTTYAEKLKQREALLRK